MGNVMRVTLNYLTEPLKPVAPMDEALSLLKAAVLISERIASGDYPPDRVDSVTWRIADALMILRDYAAEEWPGSPTPGANKPTGRGAMLRT